MTRQIKFRAWHMPFGSKGPMQQMFRSQASSALSFAEMNPDAYIVEQFTGLKDAKGQEIYEGDIVQVDPDDPGYQVIYSDEDARFSIVGNGLDSALGEEYQSCEVIGNIHENAALLEE